MNNIYNNANLKSPFVYFGGKSRAAGLIWSRFGSPVNYVEPFAGSLAVLLQRPRPFEGVETVNDADAMISNFFRALQHDPEVLAVHADRQVNENDLHAIHIHLVNERERLSKRLEGDIEYYDVKIAGYWVWGINTWIGSGWCSGKGPWQSIPDAEGVRKLVHLGDSGRGVNRQLVHLSRSGQGVNRQRVHLGDSEQNGAYVRAELIHYFNELAFRLRDVRVCCGDFSRVLGPSVTFRHGTSGILLDPPYSNGERASGLYTEDNGDVTRRVYEYAMANGDNPQLRIAVCGYEGEYDFPESWECVAWHARGGYDGQSHDKETIGKNRERERLWFSPHCIKDVLPLFAGAL